MTISFRTTKKVAFSLIGFGLILGAVIPSCALAIAFIGLDFVCFRPRRETLMARALKIHV